MEKAWENFIEVVGIVKEFRKQVFIVAKVVGTIGKKSVIGRLKIEKGYTIRKTKCCGTFTEEDCYVKINVGKKEFWHESG